MEYVNTPFNYTGNKFKLLNQILPLFDYDKDYFVDLFTGGGSVYTNVLGRYKKVLANDIITDLVNIHEELLKSDDIIKKVKETAIFKGDKEGYNDFREDYNNNPESWKLWTLMLSCTNNMLRFNKKFKFNQTYGNRGWNKNTDKKVEEFTTHIRNYEDDIIYKSLDFSKIVPKNKSMIYIDPPYNETEAGYNSYFNKGDGDRLYEYILDIHSKGHSFALSGLHGEHRSGKRSKIIDDLLNLNIFNFKYLDINYKKVKRSEYKEKSKEILIYNYSI